MSVDKRRIILKTETTIAGAKKAYAESLGRNIKQDLITDEFNFIFGDMNRRLYDFSNNCKINISFVYSDHLIQPYTSLNL